MEPSKSAESAIPPTILAPQALTFWSAVVVIGIGTGIAAALLTQILEFVQALAWAGSRTDVLQAATHSTATRHLTVLIAAGAVTGLGQLLLKKLTSGNGIDISEAIWFRAGRIPKLRTLGSAFLSIIIVGMGAPLGREGAPKQWGAVLANFVSDLRTLPDEQRRLLVACGAGAGMAAAYGVPLGGALFALEVLRGVLALRLILPALLTALLATTVSWIALPDRPTYVIPTYPVSASVLVWALLAGPIIGWLSVCYVRLIARADRSKPQGSMRFIAPVVTLALIGLFSILFPQILGNGKDLAELLFNGPYSPLLLFGLLFLRPLATVACVASGAPGGLFTPSLSFGALAGSTLGFLWTAIWPGVPPGLFALIGAGAMLAATTQGPISAMVLMFELTGHDRSFVAPVLLCVVISTLTARSIEPRSIYDARLTDEEVEKRMQTRMPVSA